MKSNLFKIILLLAVMLGITSGFTFKKTTHGLRLRLPRRAHWHKFPHPRRGLQSLRENVLGILQTQLYFLQQTLL